MELENFLVNTLKEKEIEKLLKHTTQVLLKHTNLTNLEHLELLRAIALEAPSVHDTH